MTDIEIGTGLQVANLGILKAVVFVFRAVNVVAIHLSVLDGVGYIIIRLYFFVKKKI